MKLNCVVFIPWEIVMMAPMEPPLSRLSALALAGMAVACSPTAPSTEATPQQSTKQGAGTVSFESKIKPLLANKCTICHNAKTLPTRPNFETREGALASGMIVPGSPNESRLLMVIEEGPFADKAMPPVSHRLSGAEIATLRTWIAEGADWPAGEAGRVVPAFIPEE